MGTKGAYIMGRTNKEVIVAMATPVEEVYQFQTLKDMYGKYCEIYVPDDYNTSFQSFNWENSIVKKVKEQVENYIEDTYYLETDKNRCIIEENFGEYEEARNKEIELLSLLEKYYKNVCHNSKHHKQDEYVNLLPILELLFDGSRYFCQQITGYGGGDYNLVIWNAKPHEFSEEELRTEMDIYTFAHYYFGMISEYTVGKVFESDVKYITGVEDLQRLATETDVVVQFPDSNTRSQNEGEIRDILGVTSKTDVVWFDVEKMVSVPVYQISK
jgi:hypothetical protein